MRWAFGLVSLLVTLGIIMLLVYFYVIPELQTATSPNGVSAKSQAERISGHDEDGVAADQSITLADAQDSGGKIIGYTVAALTPGGAMEKYFGLKPNDTITQISGGNGGFLDVATIGDSKGASAWLLQAYEAQGSVTVNRGGTILTLPAAPSAAPPSQLDPIQRALQPIPMH
jgi:hypothetical protein